MTLEIPFGIIARTAVFLSMNLTIFYPAAESSRVLILLSSFAFIWLYAEIHCRLPILKGLLYKKEPEIIFDAPYRIQTDYLPLLLLIKDAHWFPITLKEMHLHLSNLEGDVHREFTFQENCHINQKWFAREYQLDVHDLKGQTILIDCRARVKVSRRERIVHNDNYPQLSHAPLKVYIDSEPLPNAGSLIWGEIHAHAQWTEDQVEFGLLAEYIPSLARAMGLSFAAILEHSYDLDDKPDSWTKSDPSLAKWQAYQAAIATINANHSDFCLLPGEEVSVDNGRGKNVHLGLINHPVYFPGCGDSLERKWGYASELHYHRVLEQLDDNTLAFGAHPFTIPPLSQQIITQRDAWNFADRATNLTGYQIINGKLSADVARGLELWQKMLLQGYRYRIFAGNDAHGNFNRFRQVEIPFFKLREKTSQIFGEYMTGVQAAPSNNHTALIQSLKTKAVIVSNGPALLLNIANAQQSATIGDDLRGSPSTLCFHFDSSEYFGQLKNLRIMIGDLERRKERLLKNIDFPAGLTHAYQTMPLSDIPARGYLRAEGLTRKGRIVYTNPLWFH